MNRSQATQSLPACPGSGLPSALQCLSRPQCQPSSARLLDACKVPLEERQLAFSKIHAALKLELQLTCFEKLISLTSSNPSDRTEKF